MEHYRSVILLLLLCLAGVILKCVQGDRKEEKKPEDEEVFSPTSEWKPLKKDQAIPRGLHVRVNLATGEREAKLLDTNEEEEDDSNKRLSLLPDESVEETEERSQVDMTELKRVMQKMMEEGVGEAVSPSQEEIDKVKSKFRSYAELKKELKKMEADVKTDTEVLQETLTEYHELVEDTARDETKKKEEEEQILTFLEYLVHQIDNAQDFIIKMNGYKTVILPSLNSTHSTVRNEALRLLASAAQNNPVVQKALVQDGAVSILLRSLSADSSSSVKTSALYALSCLIRGFPAGQRVFLDKGGLSILIKQFQSDASEHLKRQLKAVTLIRDLLEEGREAAEGGYEKIKGMEYSSMSLTLRLEEEGWCEALLKLLMRHPQDDEVVEEITREMLLLAKSCSKVYRELATGASETAAWFRNLDTADNLRIHSTLEKLKEKTAKEKDELK
ncbi:nucleotide exchange factor SIL1 isoform X2 [Halyomorpha halys]|uniref:nucleotide exchange factor SIL1 isoform X2 n=1 Tax=Halyomorpha halys TaxID=286706 RepID=UPI000D0C7FE4|nr:nucleotide exchange factor SIL1 isoform X2 [Halyomorpha halys]